MFLHFSNTRKLKRKRKHKERFAPAWLNLCKEKCKNKIQHAGNAPSALLIKKLFVLSICLLFTTSAPLHAQNDTLLSSDQLYYITGLHHTLQSHRTDSIERSLLHQWNDHGNEDALALYFWSKFISKEQTHNYPAAEEVKASWDSVYYCFATPTQGGKFVNDMLNATLQRMLQQEGFMEAYASIAPSVEGYPVEQLVLQLYMLRALGPLYKFKEAEQMGDSLHPAYRQELKKPYPLLYAQFLSYYGAYTGLNQNFGKANQLLQESIDVAENSLDSLSPYNINTLASICNNYTRLLQYDKSDACNRNLIKQMSAFKGSIAPYDKGTNYYYYAQYLMTIDRLDLALSYLHKTLDIIAEEPYLDIFRIYIYESMAMMYDLKRQPQDAMYFIEKIMALTSQPQYASFRSSKPDFFFKVPYYYYEAGQTAKADSLYHLLGLKKLDEATVAQIDLAYYIESMYLYANTLESTQPKKAEEIYTYLFERFSSSNQIPASISYKTAIYLVNLLLNQNELAKAEQVLEEINNLFSLDDFLTANQMEQARFLNSISTPEEYFTLKVLQASTASMQKNGVLDLHNFDSELANLDTSLSITSRLTPYFYENFSIENQTAYFNLCNYFQEAYSISKNTKYPDRIAASFNVLKSSLGEQLSNQQAAYANDSLLYIKENLGLLIQSTQLELQNKNASDAQLFYLDSLILEENKINGRMYNQSSILNLNNVNIAGIKEVLDQDEILIDYYYQEDEVQFYVVTKDTFIYLHNNAEHNLETQILSFYNLLKSPSSKLDQIQAEGKILYDAYLGPISELVTNKKLSIIPYGSMYYLNFEALPSNSTNASQYLIETNEIQTYTNLSQFLNQRRATNKAHSVLALCPTFTAEEKSNYLEHTDAMLVDSTYLNLSDLSIFGKRMLDLSKKFDLAIFEGSNAEEIKYHENASNYDVLHIASHAIIDNVNPQNTVIRFSEKDYEINPANDGSLFINEIADLRYKAKLSILSACETGVSGIGSGLGPQSLSAAFQNSGVPTIMHTLWKVDAFKTAEVFTTFYQSLHEQSSASTSLRLAKLDVLQNSDKLQRHPYYWSGIVMIGPDQHISLASSLRKYFWYGSLVVVTLLILILLRQRWSTN